MNRGGPGFQGVVLDAGGVLITPDPDVVADSLDRAGCPRPTGERIFEAQNHGMAALDRDGGGAGDLESYLPASLEFLGIPP